LNADIYKKEESKATHLTHYQYGIMILEVKDVVDPPPLCPIIYSAILSAADLPYIAKSFPFFSTMFIEKPVLTQFTHVSNVNVRNTRIKLLAGTGTTFAAL
jgi:hypothetical protein